MMKTCSKCKRDKPESEFGMNRGRRRAQCNLCRSEDTGLWQSRNREHYNATRRIGVRPPGYQRDSQLRRDFGISLSEYKVMLARQNGVCAICFGPSGNRSFHVDHCHDTGKIRGLLCGKCNMGLGQFAHDPSRLGDAIRYLERS